MKLQDYIKENGYHHICDKCNWDLADIKNNLLRETCVTLGPQLSREMAKFKKYIYQQTQEARNSKRIEEIRVKLAGGNNGTTNI